MSGWSDVDLSTVSTDQEVLPEQVFNFSLKKGAAKFNQWNPNKVDATAVVLDGDFKGKVSFFSYPDPADFEWSKAAVARMAKATGIAINAGEGPVEYLNRAAEAGATFSAPIKHRIVTTDGVDAPKAEIQILKVKAAKS